MECNSETQGSHTPIKRIFSFAIFSLCAIALCLTLGFWQLDRASFKASLQNKPAKTFTDLATITVQDIHQTLRISGSFDNNHPVLLDNQTQQRQIGYNLYLPFRSGTKTILVNLGWMPANPTRDKLPLITPIIGEYTITGTLSASQGSPMLLGDNIVKQQGVLVVQKTLSKDIEPYLPYSLLPLMVQLKAANQFGYTNNWQPSVMPPEKHHAYALQWFLLGFAIFMISAVWMTKK